MPGVAGLGRGHAEDRWVMSETVPAGYAVATFFCGDLVQTDPTWPLSTWNGSLSKVGVLER